jgi:predicted AAA+ superfamily ATPase
VDSKKYISRNVEQHAFNEELIARHMVFLAGPRQVGKTMLAKQWLKKQDCSALYFNRDDISTRQAYAGDNRFFESAARTLGTDDPLVVSAERFLSSIV